MLAVAGAADTLTVTFRSSMVQAVTPDEFRGRVSSVEYIIGTGGGPLGNVESGTVASLTTPAVSAVSGGLACVAFAALIGLLFPAFARYRAGAVAGAWSGTGALCPDLAVKLGLGQATPDTTYQVIEFVNYGSATCIMSGYPGVNLAGGTPVAPIGLPAAQGPAVVAKVVILPRCCRSPTRTPTPLPRAARSRRGT
jgi:Domain of unknown function (DUF4232)